MKQEISKDLDHIRSMMEKSTRFVSLSGWSGILAGTYALVGAYLAHRIIFTSSRILYFDILEDYASPGVIKLIGIALSVFILSVITFYVTATNKAKKRGEKVWTPAAKRLIFNMSIPLLAGGLFIITLMNNHLFGLVAPATLIFYGISLVIAASFTYSNIKYLGIGEIILGLLAANYLGWGLYFWALGFGVFHIIYGVFMYIKYDRK